jgi:hypothetical protein
MDAHLDCETCRRLWEEYSNGVVAELRASANSDAAVREASAARQQAALEKIREHLVKVHQRQAKSKTA